MANSARYLLFSIDTEPDGLNWQGFGREAPTLANAAAMPGLLELLAPLGVKATFLVTYSMASHAPLVAALLPGIRAGICEVGMHFHPGDTPPFRGTPAEIGDNTALVDSALLREKLNNHLALLRETFGRQASFRAGAWTLDERVIEFLDAEQFTVDSSVTPGVSWAAIRRPNYLRTAVTPQRITAADWNAVQNGDPIGRRSGIGSQSRGLWEIPVSIWSPRTYSRSWLGNLQGTLYSMPLASRSGVLVSTIRRLRSWRPIWLRPAFETEQDMARAMQGLADTTDHIHVMCHSNELWPGGSPYSRTEQAVAQFKSRLRSVLQHALDQGAIPVTLAEYADILSRQEKSPT